MQTEAPKLMITVIEGENGYVITRQVQESRHNLQPCGPYPNAGNETYVAKTAEEAGKYLTSILKWQEI